MKRAVIVAACVSLALASPVRAEAAPPRQAVIAVVGNLHASWNLPTVLKDWSASPYIELVRRPSCAGYARCLTIRPEQRFPDRWGQAYVGWSKDRRTQRAVVWVSPAVPDVYLRKALLCQEVGHAVMGPAHNNVGCMNATASPQDRWPGRANLLRAR